MTATAASVVNSRRAPRLVGAAVAAGVATIVLALVAGLALHVANEGSPLAPGVTDWWVMPVVGGVAFGVAVYAIAAEALANTARHASAHCVHLEVGPRDGGLVVRVADDGVGIHGRDRPGVGLVSMRRRAEELGGALTVNAGPDARGTWVEARLPLEPA